MTRPWHSPSKGGFFAASSNVACLIQRCHAAYSTRCRSAAVTHLIRRNIHHDPSSRRNAVWRSRLLRSDEDHRSAYMADEEIMEVAFKRTDGGWIFKAPSPWLV